MTWDDLWKVKKQCRRSDVVIFWPKSCIMSAFQSMAACSEAENTISWKVGRRLYLLWRHRSVNWPSQVFFSPKVAQRTSHNLSKISARSAKRFGGHFLKKTHGGGGHQPIPLHERGLNWSIPTSFSIWKKLLRAHYWPEAYCTKLVYLGKTEFYLIRL